MHGVNEPVVNGLTRRGLLRSAAVVAAAAPLAACGVARGAARPASGRSSTPPAPSSSAPGSPAPSGVSAGHAGVLRAADLLVFSHSSLGDGLIDRIRRTAGVAAVLPITMSQVSVQDQLLVLASVDPAAYRDFTPVATADDQAVWERVATGELAVDPTLRKTLPANDIIRLGAAASAPTAHIGAWAPQIEGAIHLVGDPTWASRLGMKPRNAVLVSTGMTTPDRVARPIRKLVGDGVSVQRLDVVARDGLDPHAVQTAYVVGSVADAIGHYTYTVNGYSAHGDTVTPDPDWVKEHIVTDQVPIIGPVTANRLFFPQLQAVMGEIIDRGLGHTIIPSEYGGAYFPRYIAGTHVLSNHAFGLAIDLNVAQNERGTVGEMNRTVVSIFESWGFTWGGTWAYTDPMHFEINRLMAPT